MDGRQTRRRRTICVVLLRHGFPVLAYRKRYATGPKPHSPGSDVGERHYNLYEYAAEKRRALATWEIALAAILSPSPSVTSIAGAPRGEGAWNHGIRSLPTGPGTAPALSPSTAVLQRRDAMRDADNTERPPQSVKATLAPTWRVSAELTQPSLEVRVRNLISDLERAFLPPGKGGSLDVTKSAAAGPLERLRMQYVIGLSQICRFLADAGASLDTINPSDGSGPLLPISIRPP